MSVWFDALKKRAARRGPELAHREADARRFWMARQWNLNGWLFDRFRIDDCASLMQAMLNWARHLNRRA